MSTKPKSPNPHRDTHALIELTKSSQILLSHFQSSLTPVPASFSAVPSHSSISASTSVPNPLDVVKTTTTLLKSHTTTLSLLLLTPPLTPSALSKKIGDVSSGVLSGMVAAVSGAPQPGQQDGLGEVMRAELRAQVRRVLGAWGDVLAHLLKFVERREGVEGKGKGKDEGVTESERQNILASTGVVWEACDALLKLCQDGVVGLVVKKAESWRATLMDAVEELKEWGENVEDEEEDGDKAEGSDGGRGEFGDEDGIFGAANKLSKGDKELKELLDVSVKKLKMVGMLYQALSKRRLKTFPAVPTSKVETNGEGTVALLDPMAKLDKLMGILKSIPECADELASSFYNLDEEEARQTLDTCCGEAKIAIELVKQSWSGKDDEFTTWSEKWVGALEVS
ncbi:uncharacterized protein BDR25DRAFT_282338 [Lindgomyces ingoldianus]|uniref:Uncharacterized protein n=1 Tax=Lindgomyces ingoldianus TaxID=673940 RepID=A0ACB6R2T0_9PLEO|nr:uncharacterized protein BDR25DRAFT_282338 [Lindgomyces ingoldianus]KAF2473095.1 hypothetical protein BDR25DRAFT_282338 [Lindgomyces ingoldianus]